LIVRMWEAVLSGIAAISTIATHFFEVWSVCMSVFCLSIVLPEREDF